MNVSATIARVSDSQSGRGIVSDKKANMHIGIDSPLTEF
jgi:hypothetical protein